MKAYRLLMVLGVVLFSVALCKGDGHSSPPALPTFWVIPHTHWEGAVFKTREEYLKMGLPHILTALHLLKTQPNYRFVLDQAAYVRPFIERYPEQAADFRRFVAQGRLQIVGGMDIMPDVNMPGGETFIRQMQYGKGYYRKALGVDVTSGWLIDSFGHHAQMPQLLKLAGFQSFWFSRGVPRPDHPAEFLWQGIDGTRVPAFWLPYSYGLMFGSPHDLPHFSAFGEQRYQLLTANAAGSDRVGLSGVDVSEPEEHLAPLVAAYNAQPNRRLNLRIGVPSEFEAAAARRPGRPVFKGEFNPIFQGTYSSRIELKRRMRDMERLLTTAEKLSVLASWLGAPAADRDLWRAWEPVLFNETHDLASGVMTDHVYEDTVRSYAFAERLANEQIDRAWNRLADNIDTRGPGVALIVFNTLGWSRADIVEADVSFAEKGVATLSLQDDAGRPVPFQVESAARYPEGGLKEVRIAFIARDVPALGYAVFHAVPAATGRLPAADQGGSVLENDLYRLTVDARTGAITGLIFKPNQWDVFAGRANVVAQTPDHGDLWELYRGLDGGSKIAMKTRQPVPRPGQALFSDQESATPGVVRSGPVYAEFRVAHPFAEGSFATVIRLYHGLRRIDVATTLVNRKKFVRYQVLFPTTIADGKNVHAIPFGAMERPSGIEFPAQDWIDTSDRQKGLALLNIGLPGNVQTDGTLMLSVLRSHTLGAYGFGGGYEPGMSSDTGFELGQPRQVSYALVPHAGDWRQASAYRDGLELNNPLMCRKAASHEGRLPKRWGLLKVSTPQMVVSAVKPGPAGTVIVRLYEASGRASRDVRLTLRPKVIEAETTNLLEGHGPELPHADGTVHFDARGFEIKTFSLRLQPGVGRTPLP